MPRAPRFKPALTKWGWAVSTPPGMDGQHKRSRRFFPTEKEALSFAARIKSEWLNGDRSGIIPNALARDAAQAQELLTGTGRTILETVKHMRHLESLLHGSARSLEECVKLVLDQEAVLAATGLDPLQAARTLAKQFAADGSAELFRDRFWRFCKEMEGHWRPRYARDMEKIPRWVGDAFMKLRIGEITTGVLREALQRHGAGSPETIKMRAARVMSVIGGRGKKRRAAKIEIMTPGQCGQMLRACADPAERWAVALLLFAGIRPSVEDGEITRLDWETVSGTEIYIPHEVAKTGTDRHIPITPRLARLLRGHPAEGPVIPAWWYRKYPRLRKAAGIEGKADITRHTFASNFLAAYGEQKAKAAMGHTAGSDTLFRHYRRAVTETAGRKFFGA